MEVGGSILTPKDLRKFGLVMGGLFFFYFFVPWVVRGNIRGWSLVIAGGFLLAALATPALLRPVYTGWMRLGAVLGWFNTRMILSMFFFLFLTPIGLVMRLFGHDPLYRRRDTQCISYRVKLPQEKNDWEEPF